MSPNSSAESRYRDAFERLKHGCPKLLSVGTPVSQNNVALEAGAHPSALRKERYPELIAAIQAHVDNVAIDGGTSTPPKQSSKSDEVSELKATIAMLKARQALEASRVISLLIEVGELKKEIRNLKSSENVERL